DREDDVHDRDEVEQHEPSRHAGDLDEEDEVHDRDESQDPRVSRLREDPPHGDDHQDVVDQRDEGGGPREEPRVDVGDQAVAAVGEGHDGGKHWSTSLRRAATRGRSDHSDRGPARRDAASRLSETRSLSDQK
ncbi:hypothetical protein ABE10_03190, partial [Bacillus toyonensis]|nr:hypothetical protein [Bacillus toyonensis]